MYGRRYHDDGKPFVLPLAQLLQKDMKKRIAADAAKGSRWGWVSAESKTNTPEVSESRKRPHSDPGTIFIKGIR